MAKHSGLRPGDKVRWNTPQGMTHGTVKKRLTRPRRVARHQVRASPRHPEFLVQSEPSGKMAAHKPEALKKK